MVLRLKRIVITISQIMTAPFSSGFALHNMTKRAVEKEGYMIRTLSSLATSTISPTENGCKWSVGGFVCLYIQEYSHLRMIKSR